MDLLIKNIGSLFTLHPDEESIVGVDNYALGFFDGELVYKGPTTASLDAKQVIDGSGYIALPGLIDAHTHTVFAGSRSSEFAKRLAGANYSTILEQGGGIHHTVKCTRKATLEELKKVAIRRMNTMKNHGVTTVEIKSGYGLSPQAEQKMMEAILDPLPIRVHRTFLVHTIDSEYNDNRHAYIEQVLREQLPLCSQYADSVDIYCDRGAFTLEESTLILKTAQEKYGLVSLANDIQNEKFNRTRFAALGKFEPDGCGTDQTSIIVGVRDQVGAMHKVVESFAKNYVSLRRFESRPARTNRVHAWEYLFYIDLEGHINDTKVKKALDDVKENSVFFKNLGSYPLFEKLGLPSRLT